MGTSAIPNGAVADFHAVQFFARFYIDKRDIVRRAVCGVELRSAGIARIRFADEELDAQLQKARESN